MTEIERLKRELEEYKTDPLIPYDTMHVTFTKLARLMDLTIRIAEATLKVSA